MIKRGSIVRVVKPQRKTREAFVRTATVLCDPFIENGEEFCAIGFFSHKYGIWSRLVPVAELTPVGSSRLGEEQGEISRSRSPEYRAWVSMRARCGGSKYSTRAKALGIKVCRRWNTFDLFLTDMGVRPSPRHSLDRIDNTGDYKPGNVRWATAKEQARNTSGNRFVTVNGATKTVAQWAEECGISPQAMAYRLTHWDGQTAVTRPEGKSRPYIAALQSQRKRGTAHHLAKLTDAKVRRIRRAFRLGRSVRELATQHKLNSGTIYCVVKGKTWRHVKED